MQKLKQLTQEQIQLYKENVFYDKETGLFTWAKDNRSRNAGQVAGTKTKLGYVVINLGPLKMMAHRLAWIFENNKMPYILDHINGNGFDNRISNLREVTDRQNSMNMKIHRNGKLAGFTKMKHKRNEKKPYQAHIKINGKSVALGCFATPEEAHARYMEEVNKVDRILKGEVG